MCCVAAVSTEQRGGGAHQLPFHRAMRTLFQRRDFELHIADEPYNCHNQQWNDDHDRVELESDTVEAHP